MNASGRIKSADELVLLVEEAKKSGQKVVTTNGVYDFLHAGHLEYLEQARALGDMLIVALNTDASVRQIKGPSRPINNQQDRALIIAGLRCVDYVTFYNEVEPSQLLEKLKPSLHTKGGDYDVEKMPETKVVRQNGGEVKMLSLKSGYSNSQQFEKICTALKEDAQFERPEWLTNAQKPK